jgi:hypothetical protein
LDRSSASEKKASDRLGKHGQRVLALRSVIKDAHKDVAFQKKRATLVKI